MDELEINVENEKLKCAECKNVKERKNELEKNKKIKWQRKY